MRNSRILTAIAVLAVGISCMPLDPSLPTPDPQPNQPYLEPPADITAILDAGLPPGISISPDASMLLAIDRVAMPSILELARPVLGLAGLRIDPGNNGSATPASIVGLSFIDTVHGTKTRLEIPEGARFASSSWSPDSRRVALVRSEEDRLSLWVARVGATKLEPLEVGALNGAYGSPCQWEPDADSLLCKIVPADRGPIPSVKATIPSPTVMSSDGPAAPVRTYQNLLRSRADEMLFDHFATSQLVRVSLQSGSSSAIGEPGIYAGISTTEDGRRLLVTRVVKPYSYLAPVSRFPRKIEVWTADGESVHSVAELPLADIVPIGGVQTGPRAVHWRPGTEATLVWVEALDGGDSRAPAEERDRVMMLLAPFEDVPSEIVRTGYRFRGITWAADGNMGLLSEADRRTRRARTWVVRPEEGSQHLLFDLDDEDRYANPGQPLTRPLVNGWRVLLSSANGEAIYLSGAGSSPAGDRPFLDRLELATGTSTRLFQAAEGTYETVIEVLDDAATILTRRESKTDPPNTYRRSRDGSDWSLEALTHYPDPAPQLTGIEKRLVTTMRSDGVQLSGTLYLPAEYQAGTQIPIVFWIYPREFNSARAAGQVSGSPHRFTFFRGASHLLLLTQGFAILDGPTLPVVGGDVANDTYVDQTVRGAHAWIDAMVELGVADRTRVGVGGHSYGAFATANLLAHSDLFQAGVARSGAYNRSLTPFGFQSEQRTIWEATDIYVRMAPFFHANKIEEPMLMMHGQADTNSGTFPIQSDRMYHAIKGHGGTVALVKYPHEEHGYRARESVFDCVARMIDWFNQHLQPRQELN